MLTRSTPRSLGARTRVLAAVAAAVAISVIALAVNPGGNSGVALGGTSPAVSLVDGVSIIAQAPVADGPWADANESVCNHFSEWIGTYHYHYIYDWTDYYYYPSPHYRHMHRHDHAIPQPDLHYDFHCGYIW